MRARAAVILIQDDKIALIERHRSNRHYFAFPGGKIEKNEAAADAASREAEEELGLIVKIGPMVAEIWYQGTPQYYFLAELISGQFGHGIGRELTSQPGSEKGSYLPVWLPVDEITEQPVLPRFAAEFIKQSHHSGWPKEALVITDLLPDELA